MESLVGMLIDFVLMFSIEPRNRANYSSSNAKTSTTKKTCSKRSTNVCSAVLDFYLIPLASLILGFPFLLALIPSCPVEISGQLGFGLSVSRGSHVVFPFVCLLFLDRVHLALF